jgi:cyclase
VIASGGAAHPRDLATALQSGASAALAASLFHDGDWSVAAVKEWLAEAGFEVRR